MKRKRSDRWFKKHQVLLEKFLKSWAERAHEKYLRWFPPGMANGLMAEWLGEALELGAIVLVDPKQKLDVEFVLNWLQARKQGKAWIDSNEIHTNFVYETKGGVRKHMKI